MLLSLEVIGMFGKRNKIVTDLEAKKSENRILRLLRSDKNHTAFDDCQEGIEQENGFEGSLKEMRNAMLEAERNKALALLGSQQNNQRFY